MSEEEEEDITIEEVLEVIEENSLMFEMLEFACDSKPCGLSYSGLMEFTAEIKIVRRGS
jgi:DNA-binding IscR family transcriptional regulator